MAGEIRIWKYELVGRGFVSMPKGAVIMDVQAQKENVVVWAAVDTTAPLASRRLWMAETGDSFPENMVYVGTVQLSSGAVQHLFDGGDA